jgi:hypothetical protein
MLKPPDLQNIEPQRQEANSEKSLGAITQGATSSCTSLYVFWLQNTENYILKLSTVVHACSPSYLVFGRLRKED